jgi:hypothetical protein
MANVTITIVVPEKRLDAVYAAAAAPAGVAPAPAASADETDWLALAPKLLDDTMGLEPMGLERRLLRRLAEARAQRVPIAELVRDFGLPPQSSLTRDFPRLIAFCDADPANPRFPVVAGGDGSVAWYWMAIVDAAAFESAFRDKDRERAAQ